MRANPRTRRASLALLALLCLATAAPARAEEDLRRADPLDVPSGALPEPEAGAALPVSDRVLAAAEILRDHGYAELPVLAWALLDEARTHGNPELVSRAVELAPGSPGVRFEAARLTKNPFELFASLRALGGDLPGVLWAISLGGLAFFGGLVVLAVGVCVAAALRGFPLHGHALGHRITQQDPPAWAGVLICVAGLCLLPLFGVGTLVLVAAAGALGALRLPRGQAAGVALALTLLGVALGPGLDRFTPALVAAGRESVLLGAWRVDRGEALPGDLERVESVLERRPHDLLLRYVVATNWKRRGDLTAAIDALGEPSAAEESLLRAAAFNLRGIMRLAEGDLLEAIPAFERAREDKESAPVMFNLSQAYGRALRLSEQESAFSIASALDAKVVERYLSADGESSIHGVLIQAPLALSIYLTRALSPSPESDALARELRERLLGPLHPSLFWLALPLLGVLGFVLRRKSVSRCSRCERPLCAKCSREARATGTCTRCVRLFVKRERTDPRMRKVELDLDRRRHRDSQLRLAAGGLIAPGTADLVEGHWFRGMGTLFALGLGLAFLWAPGFVPSPWELGGLGQHAPVFLATLFLAPLYALGAASALGKLAGLRRSRE